MRYISLQHIHTVSYKDFNRYVSDVNTMELLVESPTQAFMDEVRAGATHEHVADVLSPTCKPRCTQVRDEVVKRTESFLTGCGVDMELLECSRNNTVSIYHLHHIMRLQVRAPTHLRPSTSVRRQCASVHTHTTAPTTHTRIDVIAGGDEEASPGAHAMGGRDGECRCRGGSTR